jgi:hypothetical protein
MIDRILPALVVLVIGGASSFAFSDRFAAKGAVLWILLGANGLLALVSLWRMWRDGTLLDLFKWRSGDVALGALVTLLLGISVVVGRQIVFPPGSAPEAWVIRLYLQLGPIPTGSARLLFALAIVAVASLEEIVWRGMVQQILEEWLGVRRGWILAALLYALAHLPTLWTLAMPSVGPNPLVLLAAFFCGSVWGFLVARKQRLPPALLSHALFTYAITAEFRLWGG